MSTITAATAGITGGSSNDCIGIVDAPSMTATQMADASGTGIRRSLSSELKADDTPSRASDVLSFLDIVHLLDIAAQGAQPVLCVLVCTRSIYWYALRS
ncbi:MAG: hypothetical protein ACYS29_14245, partial [Planctomycetota bacterium]